MRAFAITGDNGSYIELEDGRWADTVTGDFSPHGGSKDATEELYALRHEATHYTERPVFSLWCLKDIAKYVGA